jgi:sugar phosphate isomerase/epimerase
MTTYIILYIISLISMPIPKFGLLTNPSIDILKEITDIYDLGFDYVEIGIEVPEGNRQVLINNKLQILNLLKKFKVQSTIGHTAHWIDLSSEYNSVRQAWILEAIEEVKVAKELGLTFVNFHSNINGLYFGKRRKIVLDNWICSLQEIISYARKLNMAVMLENVPSSNGIHKVNEFRYIIDNVPDLKVHLDIPHAFIAGGMHEILEYIRTFQDKIVHIHWHDNHGKSDEHLPIGDGLINHRSVVEELKAINYNKTVTLEVFTNREDAKYSAETLNKLWRS